MSCKKISEPRVYTMRIEQITSLKDDHVDELLALLEQQMIDIGKPKSEPALRASLKKAE